MRVGEPDDRGDEGEQPQEQRRSETLQQSVEIPPPLFIQMVR